jgi:hypothetical protein
MGHFWIFGPCLMSLVYDCPPFVARETHWSHREVAVATNCCDTHGLSRRLRSEDSQKSGGEAVAMRSSNSEIPCRWCKILFVTLKDDRRVPYLSSQSSQQLFRCWLKPYIAIIFASQLASRFRQQPLLGAGSLPCPTFRNMSINLPENSRPEWEEWGEEAGRQIVPLAKLRLR